MKNEGFGLGVHCPYIALKISDGAAQRGVRYGVSPKTIENWMKSGILPFWKPSYGIVRSDLEKCDKALGRFERKSVASDN
jgi:hypothetical protein